MHTSRGHIAKKVLREKTATETIQGGGMTDEQGVKIINPETMLIIRNLRQKALYERRNQEFYIDLMLSDIMLKAHLKNLTHMGAIEEDGQEWCLNNGITGYEYITRCFGVETKK